jgi:hypothetical protein
MCCCGGEGCFSTTLTGPGKVFLQVSIPLHNWKHPECLPFRSLFLTPHVLRLTTRVIPVNELLQV